MKNTYYQDPIYNGAADPTVIFNEAEQCWWMFYTNRRVGVVEEGVSWVHGTDIGIAVSKDGKCWEYKGIAEGLHYEDGRNTYWAPEVVRVNEMYHMYVSYVPGIPKDWNAVRYILHYTSEDLLHWNFESRIELSSDRCIDACVHKLPDGEWGMWYKDEVHGSHTYMVRSKDLYHWDNPIPVIEDFAHEGPNVFYWKDRYFLIVDTWQGQGVFSSDDCVNWVRQEDILKESGSEPEDYGVGLHGDVLVVGEKAYIFYFTHPGRKEGETDAIQLQRSTIQIRELGWEDGKLICRR